MISDDQLAGYEQNAIENGFKAMRVLIKELRREREISKVAEEALERIAGDCDFTVAQYALQKIAALRGENDK